MTTSARPGDAASRLQVANLSAVVVVGLVCESRAPAPRRVGTAPSAGGTSRNASNVHGMTALA
jgi:hypothetical protein